MGTSTPCDAYKWNRCSILKPSITTAPFHFAGPNIIPAAPFQLYVALRRHHNMLREDSACSSRAQSLQHEQKNISAGCCNVAVMSACDIHIAGKVLKAWLSPLEV